MRSAFGTLLTVTALALAVGCGKKDSTTGGGGGGGTGVSGANAPPEGAYVMTGAEAMGEKMDEMVTKMPEAERTIKFSGDKMTVMENKKEKTMTVKFDPSKTPAHITTTESEKGKTETTYGIYKTEGDTLTICMVQDGKGEEDRPKEFKTSKDSKAMIMTLKKK
jgi:uncharacterized protein (TIGR03067 family)